MGAGNEATLRMASGLDALDKAAALAALGCLSWAHKSGRLNWLMVRLGVFPVWMWVPPENHGKHLHIHYYCKHGLSAHNCSEW